MNVADLANMPALPVIPPAGEAGYPYPSSGMTLRQHYAGLAIQGLLANPNSVQVSSEDLAKYAADCAGFLIAELAKPVSP